MKKNIDIILFVAILISGIFLRLLFLNKIPPALFGDEVDVGYQAYSILKTGKDYMGQSWPLSFHSLADWRTPLYLYATVPFVAIFGLNEWAVRLPAAFFGILTLPLFYLLVQKLFNNRNISLCALFLLSTSMWHLQYSRAGFEVTQMIFLIVGGIYFFLKGLEKWRYLVLSVSLIALAPYSYNTSKLFIIFLTVILFLLYRRSILQLSIKKIIIIFSVFLLTVAPMGYDILFGKAADRFTNISIFTNKETEGLVGESRLIDSNGISGRLFHNKYIIIGQSLINNYLGAFSTQFLFTKGDNSNLRHSVQGGFGEFYWLDTLLLVFGIWALTKISNKKSRLFLLLWLLISPIPSALTVDGANHASRLILMLPPLLMICALGFNQILNSLGNLRFGKLYSFLFFIFYFLFFILYVHRYYVHYPRESESWWHYGYKQMIQYAENNKDKYDKVIVSDKDQPPLIHWLFWTKAEPRFFQNTKLVWTQLSDAIWADCLPGTKYCFGRVLDERVRINGYAGTLKPYFLYLMPDAEIEKAFQHQTTASVKILEKFTYPSGRIAGYALTGL